MLESLLIEIRTEELPPKRLKALSDTFCEWVIKGLIDSQLISNPTAATPFATPRRLGLLIQNVKEQQPDQWVEKKGPSLKLGLTEDGNPTSALQGFLRSNGISFEDLTISQDHKGQDIYCFKTKQTGKQLQDVLPDILSKTFSQLPVAKIMRWGDSSFSFVRPVHGFIALYGNKILPIKILGIQATNVTFGHRFLSHAPIQIQHAESYCEQLRTEGFVIGNFNERKQIILDSLNKHAEPLHFVGDDSLINEVTSLVEWPVVLSGTFDQKFLKVPSECLILSMQQHQKYFPLKDNKENLQSHFLMVSNIENSDSHLILNGNERVLRARLSDAEFFYETDLKTPLLNRLDRLKQVVYIKTLGSVYERVNRISDLVTLIADNVPINVLSCQTAAQLCKCDLTSEMVGEFPELQGIMGKYYALHNGYTPLIAEAIEDHYHPRFANDTLPRTQEGICLALAEKIESLVGLFACGQIPTGDKDPYGLRRASLGIIRLCIEGKLPIKLEDLINYGTQVFKTISIDQETKHKIIQFVIDRLKGYLKEQGITHAEIESILSYANQRLDLIPKRIEALREFRSLAESQKLVMANKRIRNLLKKSNTVDGIDNHYPALIEPAEKNLLSCLESVHQKVNQAIAKDDYINALKSLAPLAEPINLFFEEVMIMSDDLEVRQQRISMLSKLSELMSLVADIGALDA